MEQKEKKEDRRVRRTKKNLRDNLFKLLEKKNINQITVTELTDLADINRSTFYLYYTDIYDMMDKIQDEIYTVFVETVVKRASGFSQPDDFVGYLAGFLEFCKENCEVCKFICREDCNNNLANKIRTTVRKCVPDSACRYPTTDPRFYLTTFALSAMTAVIVEWMNDGMKISCVDMARFLSYTYVLGAKVQKEGDLYKAYTHD